MTRLVVWFALGVGLAAIGAAACGGNDKPPLTPDLVEPPTDDAGPPSTPSPPSTKPPAAPAGK